MACLGQSRNTSQEGTGEDFMAYDLIIRGAQLRGLPQLMDIGISEGRSALSL